MFLDMDTHGSFGDLDPIDTCMYVLGDNGIRVRWIREFEELG